MSFWLYVSFPKEYEIIELDLEKLNLEKVFIIKNPKADGLTKGWEEMPDLQCFLLITLFFIRNSEAHFHWLSYHSWVCSGVKFSLNCFFSPLIYNLSLPNNLGGTQWLVRDFFNLLFLIAPFCWPLTRRHPPPPYLTLEFSLRKSSPLK